MSFKKHELVEIVVLSVCEVYKIKDWRVIQRASATRMHIAERVTILVLLSETIHCSLSDTFEYFPVFKSKNSGHSARNKLNEISFIDKRVEYKYLSAKALIEEKLNLKRKDIPCYNENPNYASYTEQVPPEVCLPR